MGEIGVDAGICWIGDPCCIFHPDGGLPKEIGKSWNGFCNILARKQKATARHQTAQFNYDLGHTGLGVVVSTGYGDGFYPVQVRCNKDGHIAEVRVVFIKE